MQMASQILSSGIGKSQQAMAGEKGAKVVQLSNVTKYVHDKNVRIMLDFGVKQSNTDDWLKIVNEDKTGPMLLEDHFARVKIHRFDHECISERVIDARGTGAFGKFTLIESAADVTSVGVLTDTSRETPVFLRFSTVLGSRGSADTVRDVLVDLLSSSTLKRAIGILLATTYPFSSFRTLLSFLISSMQESQSPIMRFLKLRQLTTTFGTSRSCIRR